MSSWRQLRGHSSLHWWFMGCLFTTQASPYAGPALGGSMCLFELFTYERHYAAQWVLPQFLGEQRRAVAYFTKQRNVSQGWSSCLRAVAAPVLWSRRLKNFGIVIWDCHFCVTCGTVSTQAKKGALALSQPDAEVPGSLAAARQCDNQNNFCH